MRSLAIDERVLIAGGGPVGVVTALALAQRGFPVTVFEADAHVNDAPRAATTHPATLELLADLGLIGEVIRQGLTARTFQFRDRPSGALIAEFDHELLGQDTRFPFVVQCEQHKLARLAIARLQAIPGAEEDRGERCRSVIRGRAERVPLRDFGASGSRSRKGA